MKMKDAPLQVLGWFVSQPGNMDKLKRRWWAMAIMSLMAIHGNILNISLTLLPAYPHICPLLQGSYTG